MATAYSTHKTSTESFRGKGGVGAGFKTARRQRDRDRERESSCQRERVLTVTLPWPPLTPRPITGHISASGSISAKERQGYSHLSENRKTLSDAHEQTFTHVSQAEKVSLTIHCVNINTFTNSVAFSHLFK